MDWKDILNDPQTEHQHDTGGSMYARQDLPHHPGTDDGSVLATGDTDVASLRGSGNAKSTRLILEVGVQQFLEPIHTLDDNTVFQTWVPANLTVRPLTAVLYDPNGPPEGTTLDCDKIQSEALRTDTSPTDYPVGTLGDTSTLKEVAETRLGGYLAELNGASDMAHVRGKALQKLSTVGVLSAHSMNEQRLSYAWFQLPHGTVTISRAGRIIDSRVVNQAEGPSAMEIMIRRKEAEDSHIVTFTDADISADDPNRQATRRTVAAVAERHYRRVLAAKHAVLKRAAGDGFALHIITSSMSPNVE